MTGDKKKQEIQTDATIKSLKILKLDEPSSQEIHENSSLAR